MAIVSARCIANVLILLNIFELKCCLNLVVGFKQKLTLTQMEQEGKVRLKSRRRRRKLLTSVTQCE